MKFFIFSYLHVILLPALSRGLLSGAGGFSLTAPALAALPRLQSNGMKTRIAKMII